MKLWFPFIAALLLAAPVQANDETLNKIPEALLLEGLDTVSSCLIVDSEGIKKLKEINDTNEPSYSDRKPEMMKQAEDFFVEMRIYTKVGTAMIDVLIDHYHHTAMEMRDRLDQVVNTAKTDLKENLADIDTYEEFKQVIEPKRQDCDATITTWGSKIKKYLDK